VDDFVLNVRQISQYPLETAVGPNDTLLLQQGIGGPYMSITGSDLVSTALTQGGNLNLTMGASLVWPGAAFGVSIGAISGGGTGPVFNFNQNVVATGLQTSGNIDALGAITCIGDIISSSHVFSVDGQLAALDQVVTSLNGRTGDLQLDTDDILRAGGAPIINANFGGFNTSPTPWDFRANSDQIATTAFVQMVLTQLLCGGSVVSSFNGRGGAVTLLTADVNAAFAVAGPPWPTAVSPPFGDASGRIATTSFVDESIEDLRDWVEQQDFVIKQNLSLYALLASPSFSGTPNAPTPPPGTNNAQLATTAFVLNAVSASTAGVASFNTRTGIVSLLGSDITNAGGALLVSPVFTGTPQAPTATTGTDSNQIASTAFVINEIGGASIGVMTFNGRGGAVVLTAADLTGAGGALLAGPAFTGVPTAPTATTGTSTQQLATTAFVAASVSAGAVLSFNGRTGAVTLTGNDVSAAGGALLASPPFTGTPSAPTAATGTNTTQLATTAFVAATLSAANVVSSFNGRAGTVTLTAADVTAVGGALLSSPSFVGVPNAPTAAPGDNSTQLATTAFVNGYLPLIGGTLTGGLGIQPTIGTSPIIVLNAAGAGLGNYVYGQVATKARWAMQLGNSAAESGSNAGSDFGIVRYNDTGVGLDTALKIARVDASATFSGVVTVTNRLVVSGSSAIVNLNKSGSAQTSDIYGYNGANARWLLRLGNDATETGSNLGSEFVLYRFTDTGVLVDAPLWISRANGSMALGFGANGGTQGGFQATMATTAASNGMMAFQNRVAGAAAYPAVYYNSAGGQVGYIQLSDTGTTFGTSSDRRLKDSIETFTDARELLDRLPVSKFIWKVNGESDIGIIAQDVSDVYPRAVSQRDDVLMIDYSKYVPLLIQAMQDAHARIDELEKQITVH
jgi:hypothetical protein